ncbi:GINS complex subunit [Chytridiales sp. JEL 0842]|nr:GINS complex subunit [Chytridiales sp. JEL 0842]
MLANDDVNTDVEALVQHWINERATPELLDYQGHVVESLIELLVAQTGNVESLNDESPDAAFIHLVYQQEMERIKFVIRSYVRVRLTKIERYTRFILSTPEMRNRLSPAELGFAERFQTLLDRHFMQSFMETLPPNLQRMDQETEAKLGMCEKEIMNTIVLIQVQYPK